MLNPIVSLYAAMSARVATVTPSPAPTTHRPSPNPLPARGFHFGHHGDGYGPDGQDGSTGVLLTIGAAAIVIALAAWLFLLWKQKQARAAYAAPHSPDPEAPGWDR